LNKKLLITSAAGEIQAKRQLHICDAILNILIAKDRFHPKMVESAFFVITGRGVLARLHNRPRQHLGWSLR
jgi:hypothetical protein